MMRQIQKMLTSGRVPIEKRPYVKRHGALPVDSFKFYQRKISVIALMVKYKYFAANIIFFTILQASFHISIIGK